MGGESKIFSGCWRLKSLESGLVCALGDLPKFVSGLEKVPIGSNLPDTLLQLPYKARIAIPVISTLDGGLLYPHFEEGGRVNGSAPFVARHLGLVRPPKYALTDK